MLSRFDDRMDSAPHRFEDNECDCERCLDLRTICATCKGNGSVFEHVEGGFLEKSVCIDCHGKGYWEEEL